MKKEVSGKSCVAEKEDVTGMGQVEKPGKKTERATVMLRTHGRVFTKARLRCIS